jgi:hypothetical protein
LTPTASLWKTLPDRSRAKIFIFPLSLLMSPQSPLPVQKNLHCFPNRLAPAPPLLIFLSDSLPLTAGDRFSSSSQILFPLLHERVPTTFYEYKPGWPAGRDTACRESSSGRALPCPGAKPCVGRHGGATGSFSQFVL